MAAKISLGQCLRTHQILGPGFDNSCPYIQGSYSWNDDFHPLKYLITRKKVGELEKVQRKSVQIAQLLERFHRQGSLENGQIIRIWLEKVFSNLQLFDEYERERETESNYSELKVRKKGKFKLNVCKGFLAEKAMRLKSVSASSLGCLDLFGKVEGNYSKTNAVLLLFSISYRILGQASSFSTFCAF